MEPPSQATGRSGTGLQAPFVVPEVGTYCCLRSGALGRQEVGNSQADGLLSRPQRPHPAHQPVPFTLAERICPLSSNITLNR